MGSQQAALVVNGKSRRGREWFSQVEEKLREGGFELVDPFLARDPKLVGPRVEQAIKAGMPLVCVGGGDGTFSAVAGLFIGAESVLGVVPMGTGNSLARDLGIPANVAEACQIITSGHPTAIDLGLVNGRHFVNVATVGLTTRIAEGLSDSAKKRFGRAVYLVAIFHAVVRARRFQAKIQLPDGVREFRSIQVVVGNGRFHAGPFPITPDAGITSGRLAGYSVNTRNRSTLLRYALRLWGGRHVEMPEVEAFEASAFQLHTTPTKRITVDGEIKLHTPAEFRAVPGAIRVMAPEPPNFSGGSKLA